MTQLPETGKRYMPGIHPQGALEGGRMLLTIEISQRQVRLLLRYGYPFPEVRAQLDAFKNRKGVYPLKIDSYYVPMLAGDLIHFARKIRRETLWCELADLRNVLESAQYAEGWRRSG